MLRKFDYSKLPSSLVCGEEEIAGYREVLRLIHENYDHIPIRPNIILQLQRKDRSPASDTAVCPGFFVYTSFSGRQRTNEPPPYPSFALSFGLSCFPT